MDINQSINRTATMHPYTTAVAGLLFIIAGFTVATTYTVESYLKMVGNSGDFVEGEIQRTWIERDIKARRDMDTELEAYFEQKIPQIKNTEPVQTAGFFCRDSVGISRSGTGPSRRSSRRIRTVIISGDSRRCSIRTGCFRR